MYALFQQSIQGLVSGLDRYSRYLSAEEYRQLIQYTEGDLASVDFNLNYDTHMRAWQIQDLKTGSDSNKLGLRNGQTILKIDNQELKNLNQDQVLGLLYGSIGSTVQIQAENSTSTIILVRNKKVETDIEPELLHNQVLVLKIRVFQQDTANEIKRIIDEYSSNRLKAVVLDLRNNPGGRLMEIDYLYSFLVDKPYKFVEDYEVVSRTSKLHVDYFKGGGIIFKTLKIIAAPFYYSINYLKVRKEEDKYLYATRFSKERQPKPNHFDGKLYVLINGGSFSASSIISSKLKGTNRAYFVGEETGGAYNGTVAAQMPLVTLPNSKVNMRVGLALVAAFEKSDVEGRGVFPDKVIIPTVEDRIKKVDPELNWIIDDIKREKEVKQLLQENFNK